MKPCYIPAFLLYFPRSTRPLIFNFCKRNSVTFTAIGDWSMPSHLRFWVTEAFSILLCNLDFTPNLSYIWNRQPSRGRIRSRTSGLPGRECSGSSEPTGRLPVFDFFLKRGYIWNKQPSRTRIVAGTYGIPAREAEGSIPSGRLPVFDFFPKWSYIWYRSAVKGPNRSRATLVFSLGRMAVGSNPTGRLPVF
jgi:hypothetical protein